MPLSNSTKQPEGGTTPAPTPPRVFVSYSWTSPAHEELVLRLCTELRSEGVDIVLDKWELKEGHETYAFMESMVTDPTVSKVLVISDAKYAEKADKREGGVGTETQIISAEVYNKVKQDKFIPITFEFDGDGKACLPTFMKGRLYIDLSSPAKYSENYDKVLRAVYGRPLYRKPDLGTPPRRIFEESSVTIPTQPKFRACVEAIKQDKKSVPGLLGDYFDEMVNVWRGFSLYPPDESVPLDELVIGSIKEALPARNEIVDLLHVLFVHRDEDSDYEQIHRFLEQIAVCGNAPSGAARWDDSWADNYVFLNYELFLHIVALLIRHDRYGGVDVLLEPYFVRDRSRPRGGGLTSVRAFLGNVRSLDVGRNQRLKLNRTSVTTDILRERAVHPQVTFDQIMLADLIIQLRCFLDPSGRVMWRSNTLVLAQDYNAFEFFARGESARGFAKVKALLKVTDKADLEKRLAEGMKGHRVGEWHWVWNAEATFLNLICLKQLDTSP